MRTECWVVVQMDTKGQPRGFEKSNGRFHLTQGSADLSCSNQNELLGLPAYRVMHCILQPFDA